MNLSEVFIRRPVMTTLIMLGVLLFGILAYRALPVSDLPNVDYPTIQVTASLPGASPETMAAAVATPLERQFSTIQGLDSMVSSNSQGVTNITLQFSLSRNIDAAAQDVQAMITAAEGNLPAGMPSPPTYQKVNPSDTPILFMAVYSPTLPLSTVDQYADTLMAERISMISGVAQVSIYGETKYAVRIQLDPKQLAARGIGVDQVTQAIQSANVDLPTGTLYGQNKAFTVQANGQLMDAAAFRPLIVAYRNGSPVRLDQVANVIDSIQNDKAAAWYNGERAEVLAIQRQPGTNTIDVVNNIRKLLPVFEKEIPASIHLSILHDRSQLIRSSVNDVKFTLYITLCLVILVIFIFLRNVSATLIPSLALPLAIVGTFGVMYLLGYTIDNLSLMAMVLATGFVVDDAIVMLENIVRHMEMGEGVFEAALNGSKEISFTILSMTLSLAAVFIPIFFMAGIIGRVLHEFAVVIISTVIVSGVVSLTLTPMLASRFLRHPENQKHGRLYMVTERGFQGMHRAYAWSLGKALKHRFLVLLGSIALLAATAYLFIKIPTGFIPSEDTGLAFGQIMAQQGISYDAMVRHMKDVRAVLEKDPDLSKSMTFAGVGGPGGGGVGGFFFTSMKDEPPGSQILWRDVLGFLHLPLPPENPKYRYLTTDQVIAELRPKLDAIPGILAFIQNPPPIQIGARLTRGQYQYTLEGPDTTELYRVSNQLLAKMESLPGLQDLSTDLQMANPQADVEIDRDKAQTLGVSPLQIESALAAAYSSGRVSTIYAPNDEYWVIEELGPKYQRNPSALSMLYVTSSTGQLVPLDAVTKIGESLGPLSVNHTGQLPSVTLSFNLKPGFPLSQAVSEVQQVSRDIVPADISATFQGTAQQYQQSLVGLGLLLLATVLIIYLVLGILYESFIHPITILSGLPSAAFGALLTLMAFHMELDLYGFVGVIMLIGIVKKNAIMMIDFALDAERSGGKSSEEAIYQGALIRFRPIMMTTFAALFGIMPIAFGVGAGADSRRPIGLVVVGGLIFSQVVTLYITPVYYVYLDKFQHWLGRNLRKTEVAGAPETLPPEPVPSGHVLAAPPEAPAGH